MSKALKRIDISWNEIILMTLLSCMRSRGNTKVLQRQLQICYFDTPLVYLNLLKLRGLPSFKILYFLKI